MNEPQITEGDLGIDDIERRWGHLYGKVNANVFLRFSFAVIRLEFALISRGFIKHKQYQDDYDRPDFLAYVHQYSEIKNLKCKISPIGKRAIGYIVKRPPMKLDWQGGQMEWVKLIRKEPIPDNEFCALCIMQLRNNLFHGGKERDQPGDERNILLLNCSVRAIYELINLDPVMHSYFTEMPFNQN